MVTLDIPKLHCDGCARTVTKAIQSVDPGATVTPDIPRHAAEVETVAPVAEIIAVLEEAGYPATVG